MAESILVTGKKISSMELVTNVTGIEKIPTGQPDDLAITPNQIADHTITRGDLASHGDLSQVEVDLTTQIATLAGDVASADNSIRGLIAAEEAARIAGDDALQAAIDSGDTILQSALDAEVAARIAADDLKVDKEGSVSSVAGRVGDVSLVPSDVLVEGFGSQEEVNKYVPKPFLSGYTYGLGERVVLDNGDVVQSVVSGNTADPSADMTGWVNVPGYKSEYVVYPSTALDHTAELQAAIDYCTANSLNCKPIGLFKTSGKVVIKGEFDGSRCRVQTQAYGPITSTPIAVEVSTGIGDNPTTVLSLLDSQRIILPDVVNGTKPTVGWDGQGIGVRYVNVQNTLITERLVQDFAIGVQHTSYTQGCGYCAVDAGYLRNNKVNRQFTVGDDTGFTNRWDLYGGRYFHSSSEGTNVEGCIHFDVVPNATGNIINDINHFGGSLEGLAEQYHIRLGGSYINFWGIRLENKPETGGIKVHLASSGIPGQGGSCGIFYGRGITADDGITPGRIKVTADPLATTSRFTILSEQGTSYVSVAGIVEIKRSGSSPNDFIYCGVDPTFNYGEDASTNYSFGISANSLKGKRKADVAERVMLDFLNGRTYYGNGSVAPSFYIGQQGGNSLATNANWIPQANATHTLGGTGFAWDRLFLAKGFGAFGVAPLLTQPTITGKKTPATIAEQNAVLDSIVTALAAYGLVADGRTA